MFRLKSAKLPDLAKKGVRLCGPFDGVSSRIRETFKRRVHSEARTHSQKRMLVYIS